MRLTHLPFVALALVATLPTLAQQPIPGSPNVKAVTAGTYAADSRHTEVAWTINHLGFSFYHGLFGNPTGTLILDPAHPAADKLTISFPIANVVTTNDALNKHIMAADMMDAAQFPTGTFTSTKVVASGTRATIEGNLTLKGVTRPITLHAHFIGTGINPLSKKVTVGFEATATLNRGDFGINYLLPSLSNRVDLTITGAFEKN